MWGVADRVGWNERGGAGKADNLWVLNFIRLDLKVLTLMSL